MERPKHLGARVRVLAQNIKQAFDRKLTALGLTTQQSFALRYLYEHSEEKVYPKDIEKRFDLTHPTVSGLIQRLEAKNFVVCEPDDDDHRRKRIRMTQKAETCQQEIFRHILSTERILTAGMSPEEVETFLRLLSLANDNLCAELQKEELKQ